MEDLCAAGSGLPVNMHPVAEIRFRDVQVGKEGKKPMLCGVYYTAAPTSITSNLPETSVLRALAAARTAVLAALFLGTGPMRHAAMGMGTQRMRA